MSGTPEHIAWKQMRGRCNNPRNRCFKHYGGRGIKVCDEWNSFEAFFAYVGKRPSDKHSLDRINVNQGYEPGNVRWATSEQQQNNRRNNSRIVEAIRDAVECSPH
jgi:hypothetical protein